VFTHPGRMEFVFGSVEDLSATGVSFVPADRQQTRDIQVGDTVPVCSLRVGEHRLSFGAGIVRNERSISLVFSKITDGERALIRSYIDGHAQRELDRIASDTPSLVEPV